jgi:predicted permease
MTDAAAQRELDGIMRQIGVEHREAPQGGGVDLETLAALPGEVRRGVALFMGMLMTFASLILLVAGGNVASMLLARALERRREIAVRLALGAGRARLVRHLTMETLLLFLLGAAGAVLLTRVATSALGAISLPVGVPLALSFPLDGRVLGFGLAVALIAGIGFGLIPALPATRAPLASQLRAGDRAATGRSRTWNLLVAGQVTLTVLLLAGAGVLGQALRRAATLDIGFDSRNVFIATTDLDMRGYDQANGRAAVARWRERVAAIPGVVGAAVGSRAPLGLGNTTSSFVIDGRDVPPSGERYLSADYNAVSPEFFSVLAIPIIAGRGFTASDAESAPAVAVVSNAFARRWLGSAGRALGRTIRYDARDTTRIRIVGVAADIKVRSLAEEPRPYLYRPIAQARVEEVTLFVRGTGPASGLGPAVRNALRGVDDGLPLMVATSFQQHIGVALIPQRLAAAVGATLGAVGLFLAGLGIYGIVAYALSQRGREIGIRIAIGATPRSVVALIAREGARLAGLGLMAGLALALVVTQAIRAFLLGVSPWDPATLGAIALVITVAAAVASLVPARKAAAIDPVQALRGD